jgi:MerR family mercuric resistance operon transcriptional regulator
MRIGELAKQAGVNIQTIRFYERERVMRAAPRSPSGYRSYTNRDLQHVQFVKRCQQLGFTLAEIKQLAGLHESLAASRNMDRAAMERFSAMAGERLKLIDSRIEALQEMRRNLAHLIAETSSPAARCLASQAEVK